MTSANQEPLSIINLLLEATLPVQIVMAMLVLASVVSWVMIFQRAATYRKTKRELEDFEDAFWSGMDLSKLYKQGSGKSMIGGIESVFRAGFKEFSRLSQQASMDSQALLAGSERSMRVALAKEEEALTRHLPFLANVGSASPYVGLFGTVWGIMNAFYGLSGIPNPTLAEVAPGITEALVATAMGLFAAIPAVIAYNRFAARVDVLLGRYETFADEFSGILQRQSHAAMNRQQQRGQGGS